jgi:hypothetical protein
MTTETEIIPSIRPGISTGAGLAIAGIWLACATVSVFVMLILFVWSDPATAEMSKEAALFYNIFVISVVAAPLATASITTGKIIDKVF